MEPEPQRQCVIPIHKPTFRELAFFFSSGILVSIPFTLFFSQFYSLVPVGLAVVILAPFIEELAKVFPLFYRHGETERSCVTLGVLIGLGFGISEFVLYIAFLGVSPIARFSGIIFHSSSTAITAYGIAKKNPLPYYMLSVGLHIMNNFFAIAGDVFFGLFVELFVLISVYLMAWRLYNKASKDKMVF